jgi:hypothetical protein
MQPKSHDAYVVKTSYDCKWDKFVKQKKIHLLSILPMYNLIGMSEQITGTVVFGQTTKVAQSVVKINVAKSNFL